MNEVFQTGLKGVGVGEAAIQIGHVEGFPQDVAVRMQGRAAALIWMVWCAQGSGEAGVGMQIPGLTH